MAATERSELPDGWTTTTLGEAADYLNGRAFKSTEWGTHGLPIIRIQNLNDPNGSYNYSDREFESRYKVETGDLLFAWSASLGAYIWRNGAAWLNQHIFRVDPKPFVDRFYLFYFLNSIVAELYSQAHGSGMVHITKKKFYAIPLLLPPLNEQRRIVAKIEELFSELDKGVESLKAARAQLKTYRQSLLKAAFEGRLTEQWRRDNADKLETADQLLQRIREEREARYQQQLDEWKSAVESWEAKGKKGKKPRKPSSPMKEIKGGDEILFGSNLPHGWTLAAIAELGEVSTGSTPPTNEQENYGGDWPFYKPTDLDAGNNVAESRDTLSDFGFQGARTAPAGSVLVTCIGATIGKTGRLTRRGAFNQQINAIDPVDLVNSKFLYLQILSDAFQRDIRKNASSTTLPILNKSRFESLEIRICSPEEQTKIVEILEQRLSQAEYLDTNIEARLVAIDKLRQAVLKRAFEGKLVPQDPDDEPASVLLERIRAERGEASEARGRRRKANA